MTYSVRDVVEASGINAGTVHKWLLTDVFPSSKNGRKYVIDEETYHKMVEHARERAGNSTPHKRGPALSLQRSKKYSPNPRKWATVEDQIQATLSGEIEPIYLNRKGDRVK